MAVVIILLPLLNPTIDSRGKEAYGIHHTTRGRANEITQAKTIAILARYLLAQEGEALSMSPIECDNHIVSLTLCINEEQTGMGVILALECIKHLAGIVIETYSLLGTGSF